MSSGPGCPYGPAGHARARKHEHEYSPPPEGQRQCSCGGRGWVVSTGGMLGTQVRCSRCGKVSRLNTLHESGRIKGRAEGWKLHADQQAAAGRPGGVPF